MYTNVRVNSGEQVRLRTKVKVYFTGHPTIEMIQYKSSAVVTITGDDDEGRLYWDGPEGSTCRCWKNQVDLLTPLEQLAQVAEVGGEK